MKSAPAEVSEAVMAAITADIAALHTTQGQDGSLAEATEKAATPDVAETTELPQVHDTDTPAPHEQGVTSSSVDDSATTTMAADLAGVGSKTAPQGEPPAVDYREIIANTIAHLEHNSAEARRAVYDHAREVVHQRLAETQPPLSPEMIKRERAALDRIIDKIEAEAEEKRSIGRSRILPARTAAKPIEPVVIPKRRDLPQAKHFHGGTLRLFAMAGFICAGLLAYWFIVGRPGMKSAVAYLPALPGSATSPEPVPVATQTDRAEPAAEAGADAAPPQVSGEDTSPAPSNAAAEEPSPPQEDPAPGDTAVHEAARSLAANPLMTFKIECDGTPCGDSTPSPPTSADSAAWIASYSTIKSPPRSNKTTPQNSKEAEKLLDAGRAAAAPSATGSYQRGLDKAKNDDSDGAIRDFSEAIQLEPNFADAYVQRGNLRFKNGNPELAIADYRAAIGIDERNAAAFKARGMARLYDADEDGALEDLSKAIQIAESEPARLPPLDLFFARRTRASVYSRRRAGDRELFDLSAMIDAYWKNPDLADALKGNYGAQGASALMATIYRQRAALYVQRANADGAIADLSFALQLDPTRTVQLILERARIQEAAGRREQAAADFKRVLQVNPRVDEARQAIVRLNAKP